MPGAPPDPPPGAPPGAHTCPAPLGLLVRAGGVGSHAAALLPRELMVLILLSRDHTVAQVSDVLAVSRTSVLSSANTAAARLGALDWAAAVDKARGLGLVR